jgi:hypothetical protein
MEPLATSRAPHGPDPAILERVPAMDLDEVRFHIRRLLDARLASPLSREDRRLWDCLVVRERLLLLLRSNSA